MRGRRLWIPRLFLSAAVAAAAWSGVSQAVPPAKPAPAKPAPAAKPTPSTAAKPTPASTAAKPGDVNAALKWALDMNSPKYGKPPTDFHHGSVTPATLPKDAVTHPEGRFVVQFPSHAPVTTPAVFGGKIVVSGGFSDQALYAFDAHTGGQVWGERLDDDGPSAPACAGGVCVVATESCTVFAVAADTGKLLWSVWLGDPLLSSPTIAHGKVFTAYPATSTADGKPKPPDATHVLAAFDLHTGKILWQRWIDGDVMSAPVAVGDDLHFTTFAGSVWTMKQADGHIEAVERAHATSAPTVVDGDLLFSQRSDEGGVAHEALVKEDATTHHRDYRVADKIARYIDGAVQTASGYGAGGTALDAGNGFGGGAPSTAGAGKAEATIGQGTVSRLQAYQGSTTVVAGGLSVNSRGDEVTATDRKTGKQAWSMKVSGDLSKGGYLATTPAVAGDKLVIGLASGAVAVVDAKTGKRLRTFQVGGPVRSQPLVSGGWIYVATDDGRLVGIDTGDPSLTGWTHWGGNAQRTGMTQSARAAVQGAGTAAQSTGTAVQATGTK